ncbi:MAG: hypothetical protein N3A38_15760, partial [Planctomycetota bacterium]|nr:hypothetical protein [Planctomycetota bacterium]
MGRSDLRAAYFAFFVSIACTAIHGAAGGEGEDAGARTGAADRAAASLAAEGGGSPAVAGTDNPTGKAPDRPLLIIYDFASPGDGGKAGRKAADILRGLARKSGSFLLPVEID